MRIGIWLASIVLGLTSSSGAQSVGEKSCKDTVDSLDFPSLTADIVIYGELHGNNESPEVFLAAICQYIETVSGDVRIALELPTEMQTSLNGYMESSGNADAVQQFLSHEFWRRERFSQDGRSSTAMLNLVESLRNLGNLTERLISVTAINGRWDDTRVSYGAIDSAFIMAANIDYLSRESTSDVVFVLMGNFHARRRPPENISYVNTVASLLEEEFVSVLLLPQSGESWNCQIYCQPWPVPEVTNVADYEKSVLGSQAYDYVLPIGRVSSSSPAYESM